MSIHVQISAEAKHRLNIQKRNSTLLSIGISVLALSSVTAVLGLFLLPSIMTETQPFVFYTPSELPTDATPKNPTRPNLRKTQPTAFNDPVRVIVVATPNTQADIPVAIVDNNEPSEIFSSEPDLTFTNEELGSPLSKDFESIIPQDMQKRCSKADRLARLEAEGGIPESEEAVVKALDWLKNTQNSDGSWDKDHPVGMTGLALLAYLGHCETPQSKEYSQNVFKGITYLIDIGMKREGMLTDKEPNNIQWVYDHGIATYALAEAYTFCKQIGMNIPNLDTVTKQAGDIIIEGQADSGSWVYKYEKSLSGDNSVGFWQIQALKACKHTKLWEDKDFTKTIRKAHEWLDKVQSKEGAIGYGSDPTKSPELTGGGVLAFQMWDKGKTKNTRNGIDWISKNANFEWNDEKQPSLYHHYYYSQAMINYGGKEWSDYNLSFRDTLIKAQNPDGSWNPHGGFHGTINQTMATTMATLMLEVYYRFLPGTGSR